MSALYSVVIPTHNRCEILPEVLRALESQEHAPPFEIVVVDDGSTDDTAELLRSWAGSVPCRILSQANAGPAQARNRGVQEARGRWVAFLGDDTVPSAGWLAQHHRAREERGREGEGDQLAVLGYTEWHPRMRLDPFLRHINEHGLQFGYALIEDPEDLPFNFLYTSNLSLGRELLLREPFDLRFPYAAWEDTELSYRLVRGGMRLIYEPKATVAHDHPTDLSRFIQRQERVGYSAVVFHALHPELGSFLGLGPQGPPPVPGRWPQAGRELLARLLQVVRWPAATPRLWEELLRFHYIRGLHRGWSERQSLLKGDEP